MFDKNQAMKQASNWLSDEDYQKAVGSLRLHVAGVLGVFDTMGMGVFINEAAEQIVKLSEDFGLRVRGIDKMIGANLRPRRQD